MGCSPSSKPSTNVTQGTPGSARAQDQAIIEATRAAIRAEVARVKTLPAEERSKLGAVARVVFTPVSSHPDRSWKKVTEAFGFCFLGPAPVLPSAVEST